MKKNITIIITLFCTIGAIAHAEIKPQFGFPTDLSLHAVKTEKFDIYLYEEQTNFLLTQNLPVDIIEDGMYNSPIPLTPGVVPAGTYVNCYLLHADAEYYGDRVPYTGIYTFNEPILGVIVTDTNLEVSDSILGRSGTTYAIRDGTPPNAEYSGLDFWEDPAQAHIIRDTITVLGQTVTLDGVTSNKMDELRVITLATMPVGIDIKPGCYPNPINLGSHGLVPVAILSDEAFDATTVNPDTVELAGANLEVKVKGKSNKYMAHAEDVNGDGLVDLLVQVATANLDPESLQDGWAVLTAETFDGRLIEGSDEITIVPPEN